MSDSPAIELERPLQAAVERARRARADAGNAARAFSLLDFTSLNDDDDEGVIRALCRRAVHGAHHVAAVCVYPPFVPMARILLAGSGVRIATVVNFPQPHASPARAAWETRKTLDDAADEVDLVFPYPAFLAGDAATATSVVRAVREACGSATLKVIFEVSRLPDAAAIRAVSRLCLEQGVDFLKTSTGKVGHGATLETAAVMLSEIRAFADSTGRRAGFKPAGGVKTADDAAAYLALATDIVGADYCAPATLRIGASSVMDALLHAMGEGETPPPPAGTY